MQNTIIDPMWIYYASILNFVSKASVAVAIVCGVAAFFEFMNYDSLWEEERWYANKLKNYKKRIRFFTITFIITAILAMFIPSKTTLLEMFVASKLTPETIQQVGGTTESIASKAAEIISEAVIKVIKAGK